MNTKPQNGVSAGFPPKKWIPICMMYIQSRTLANWYPKWRHRLKPEMHLIPAGYHHSWKSHSPNFGAGLKSPHPLIFEWWKKSTSQGIGVSVGACWIWQFQVWIGWESPWKRRLGWREILSMVDESNLRSDGRVKVFQTCLHGESMFFLR